MYADSVDSAIKNADIAFIFTEWNEIRNTKLNKYVELMKTAIVYDGRNCYDLKEVKEYNMDYYSIGREEVLNLQKKKIQDDETVA